MNNLSSYCGLVDAKIRASDKDLPVQVNLCQKLSFLNQFTHNMTRYCSLNSPKNTSSEHVVYKYCFECQNKNKNLYLHFHEVFLEISYYYKYQDKMHVYKNKKSLLRKNSSISPF